METRELVLVVRRDDEKHNPSDEADQITQSAGDILAHARGSGSHRLRWGISESRPGGRIGDPSHRCPAILTKRAGNLGAAIRTKGHNLTLLLVMSLLADL